MAKIDDKTEVLEPAPDVVRRLREELFDWEKGLDRIELIDPKAIEAGLDVLRESGAVENPLGADDYLVARIYLAVADTMEKISASTLVNAPIVASVKVSTSPADIVLALDEDFLLSSRKGLRTGIFPSSGSIGSNDP